MRYWRRFEAAKPRKAKGGIKARSRRGVFAESWWGKRWIEVLESFDIGSRISRGKAYARKGQVTDLQVKRGYIEARVQGTGSRPYKVHVGFPVIPGPVWGDIARGLKSRPFLAAELLAGRVPENIEEVFDEVGTSLFPTDFSELESSCSCPDGSNPCKHIAAVFFLIAEALDGDPFLLFTLRGLDRDDLLELMGGYVVPESQLPKKLYDEPVELNSDPELFWNGAGDVPVWPVTDNRPVLDGVLVRRLGPFPFWRGIHEPLKSLIDVYRDATDRARSHLFDEEE
jgi:uncharacterized Zn finger protein